MEDLQRKFKFANKIWTVEEFSEVYGEGQPIETVMNAINKLEADGYVVWVDGKSNQQIKAEKILQNVAKQNQIVDLANQADEFDQQAELNKREQKRENQLKHKGYYLMFNHIQKARIFEEWVAKTLGLQTEITFVLGQPKLIIYNVTDSEIATINRKFTLENGIDTVVSTADKTLTSATKAVDYAATKVVAPVVQVGAKAGVSILGSIAKTGAKSLGTIISAVATGSKQCISEIKHDDDVLRAGRELIQAKNEIRHGIANKTGHFSAGNGGYID